MNLVSIVIPAANQADHIRPAVEAFRAALGDLPVGYEIVLVVNRSRDRTLEVCQELEAAHAEVRTIESRPGWGAAVKAGLEAARGDLLCYTNSARTQPDDLALMIRFGLVNEEMAIKASRKVRDSLVRRLGSVIYNFEARMLFRLAVWDVNGTPKVFARRHLPSLNLTEDGDLIDLQFVVNAARNRVPIVEVPIYLQHRRGGRSTTNLRSAWKMYLGALRAYLREPRRK